MTSPTTNELGFEVALKSVITRLQQNHATCDRNNCPWPSMAENDIEDLAYAMAKAGYAIVDSATGQPVAG